MARFGQLLAVWGGDRARPRLGKATILLGADPDAVYALGERGDTLVLETWSADNGVRASTAVVASGAQLRCEQVWRGTSDDLVVLALRTLTGTELATLDLRTGALWNERPLPANMRLVAASRDGRVQMVANDFGVDLYDGTRRLPPLDAAGTVCALTPDGRFAAWVSTPPCIHVRSLDNDALATWELPDTELPDALCLSADGATLWSMTDGELCCWDVTQRSLVGRWTGASRRAQFVAVARDGGAVLLDGPIAFARGDDAPVAPSSRVWEPRLARLSPDARRLAHASPVLGWYDLARDTRLDLHADGHAAAVLSLAVSPDGRLVASASADRSIRVCEAATGRCVCALEGDAEGFGALAFAPDARTLYAVTWGRRERLTAWNLDEATEITPQPLEVPGARSIAVSADGRRLVTSRFHGRRRCGFALVDLVRFAVVPTPLDPIGRAAEMLPGFEDGAAGFTEDGARVRVVLGATPVWRVELSAETGGYEHPGAEGDRFEVGPHGGFTRDTRRFVSVEDDPAANNRRVVVVCRDVARRFEVLGQRADLWMARPLTASALGNRGAAFANGPGEVVVQVFRRGWTWSLGDPLRTEVNALCLSPDESRLYVGTASGQVRVCVVDLPDEDVAEVRR